MDKQTLVEVYLGFEFTTTLENNTITITQIKINKMKKLLWTGSEGIEDEESMQEEIVVKKPK